MKRLVNKFRKKKTSIAAEQPSTTRITNETVAAHRESILAGGRKFKYPLQTPKHRIVVVTVLIVVLTFVAFFGGFTWSLYVAQNTSQFAQRLTQVLPYPVASVDGQLARYSDYLLELRSSMHYLSTKENINFSSEDGKRQLEYQKRIALNKTIDRAYVAKLANEQKLNVSSKEVDAFVDKEINSGQLGVSEQVFKQVIQDYYGWSFDEYRSSVEHQLLRKKVVAKMDTTGRARANAVLADVTTGGKDFAEEAKVVSDDPTAKTNGGDVGFVSKTTDDPNGLVAAASALQPGQVSQVIEGSDGFYIVKLTEAKDNTIRFSKIYIAYTVYNQKLSELRKNGKIQEYIKVAETASPTNQ